MIQLINFPFCLDCGIKLDQVDELIERLQGLYTKFSLLLACVECSKKRIPQSLLKVSDDDDRNGSVETESVSLFKNNLVESKQIAASSSPNVTQHLKIEVVLSDDCEPMHYDDDCVDSPELEQNESKIKIRKKCKTKTKSKTTITVTCEPCNKHYSSLANLRRHMSATHGKLRKTTPYDRLRNCRLCFVNFNKPNIRLKHEQTAHFNVITKKQQCTECDFTHESFDKIVEHRLTHDNFTCSVCGVVKPTFDKWRQHGQRHSRTQKPIDDRGCCVVCDQPFEYRKDLRMHERKHHKNPITKCYKCNQCDFESSQRRLIRDHIIEHTGRMPYICDVCGCGHSSQLLLTNHIKRDHINKPKYQCNICQRVCHQKSALDRHLLVHQPDERPFKCNFCDKTYRDATDLRRHKRSHGSEVPKLACDKCDKRFYEPKQLRNHQRVYQH